MSNPSNSKKIYDAEVIEEPVYDAEVIDEPFDIMKIGDTHPVFVSMTIDSTQARIRNTNAGYNLLGNRKSQENGIDPQRIQNINCNPLHISNLPQTWLQAENMCLVNIRPIHEDSDSGPFEMHMCIPSSHQSGEILFQDANANRPMNWGIKIYFETKAEAEKVLQRLEKNPSCIWPFFKEACKSVPEAKDMLEGKRNKSRNFFQDCSYLLLRETARTSEQNVVRIDGKKVEPSQTLQDILVGGLKNKLEREKRKVEVPKEGVLQKIRKLFG